jgi:cell division protein FtsW
MAIFFNFTQIKQYLKGLIKSFIWDFRSIDKKSLVMLIIIISIGFVFTLSAIYAVSVRIYINPHMLLIKHLLSIGIGCFLFMFFIRKEIEVIEKISLIAFIFILGLIYTLPFFATTVKGSKRWIDLGFFSIQPSEILKPFFVVVNSIFINKINSDDYRKRRKGLASSVILILIVGFPLIIQPDIGMFTVYLIVWAVQLFIYGIRMKFFYYLSVVLVGLCVILYTTLPHFKYRIGKYLSSSIGVSSYYQAFKAKQAIKSGSFGGNGIGGGVVKYQIPDSYSDYIFCVMIEELGFFTMLMFSGLYLIFLLRQFLRSSMYDLIFIRVLIVGLITMIAVPFFIHIGVNTNLLPSKGMTWPLISYGGSSTISSFILLGILFSITRKDRYNIFKFNNLKY